MSKPLVIYGSPPSQPSRAVYWTCLLRGLAFELRLLDFGRLREPEFTRLNPKGQVPTIDDDGFVLYEMPAILGYLCDKHGWNELYPAHLETRALVNQYLHFHHSSTRLATFKLMAPHVTVAFGGPGPALDALMGESIRVAVAGPDPLGSGRQVIQSVAEMLQANYFRGTPFLCGTDAATIADIACYEELAQLRWAELFDFAGFPTLQDWLARMEGLPFHEPVHAYNRALGDIATRPNTRERFIAANRIGVDALRELGGVSLSL